MANYTVNLRLATFPLCSVFLLQTQMRLFFSECVCIDVYE